MANALIFGGFGLIVGSFINVLVLRWNTGKGLSGRSGCLSCGKGIAAGDLIPVLSWIRLRRRCRNCGGRISWQYPMVELSCGVLFGLIGAATLLPLTSQLVACVIAALFVAISAYDLRHTIIPDVWVYGMAFLGLISQLIFPLYAGSFVFVLFAGPIVAFPLYALWFLSRGRGIGFGDVKLALAIGWLLGPAHGLLALGLAYIIGAAVSLLLLSLSSRLWKQIAGKLTPTRVSRSFVLQVTMKSEIPFGPFLIFACTIVWISTLYSQNIFAPLGF